MSIVVRQVATPVNNNNSPVTSHTIVFSSNTLAGNAVFICIQGFDTNYTMTPPGGDTWTDIIIEASYIRPGFANYSSSWIAASVAGGTTSYTFTSSSADFSIAGGYEISGLDPSPLIGSEFLGGQGSVGTPATSYSSGAGVFSAGSNCIVIGYGGTGSDSGLTMAAGSGFSPNFIQATGTFNQFATEYKIVGSGTYNATATTDASIIEGGFAAVLLKEGPASTFVGLDMTPGRGISYGRSYGVI